MKLPTEGCVLITVADQDKPGIRESARLFTEMGFCIKATEGTRKVLQENGIASEPITKIGEGRPNIVDEIKNNGIHLVINSPSSQRSKRNDAYIRKSAIQYKVPYITTTAAALSAAKGIGMRRKGQAKVKSLQAYHADIK